MITRKPPDGIYLRGTVQEYPFLFTTDIGASKIIISTRVYDSMQPADRPALERTSKPVGASSVSIKERWKGTFAVRQGPAELEVDVSVVDIDDEGLLGVDELQNGKNGPSDIVSEK